jgi:DNA-binding transcriptional regulator YhcF (GntR family)
MKQKLLQVKGFNLKNIMYQVKIAENNRSSKLQQIVAAFVHDIDRGVLKKGEKLPTINEFSKVNGVSRDTIEKAYRAMKALGYITSSPCICYFVNGKNNEKLKVLLIFNRFSSFKKVIYDAMLEGLGKKAQVNLSFHHYSLKLLKEVLITNLGRYDFYAIMPHFDSSSKSQEYQRILEMVPSHQLILLDKQIPDWGYTKKMVYQDFKVDIYEALSRSYLLLKKYKSISLVFQDKTNHPQEIIEGIEDFCLEQRMAFKILSNVENEVLKIGCVYIVLEEDDLAKLIKKVHRNGMLPGKDIGIISFNESVFKELLNITVFTTDFEAMGRTAADFILGKRKDFCRNPFYALHRGSL